MNRWSSFLLTIVFCLIVAGVATKFSMAATHSVPSTKLGGATVTPQMTPTPTPTPTPSPVATPTPSPVITPVPQRTATTNGFVHMRADKSTSSAIVTDLQAGTVVILGSDETSLWQQASFGSYRGYIWKSYLTY